MSNKLKIYSLSDYHLIKDFLLQHQFETKAISFVNPFSYYMMLEGEYVSRGVDGFFVDGGLLVSLLKLRDGLRVERVSFDYSSIAEDFFIFCEQNKLRVSFVGATPNEMEAFLLHICKKYPKMLLGFCCSGYFSSDCHRAEVVEEVSKSDVVVVGMGAPLQENFSLDVKEFGCAKLVITCGGFFSQTSMRDDYYYSFVKKLGVRWLQRLILHKHVRHKVFREYPKFIIKYLSGK